MPVDKDRMYEDLTSGFNQRGEEIEKLKKKCVKLSADVAALELKLADLQHYSKSAIEFMDRFREALHILGD